ncbi:unnamed protein product [Knipowitschia caucasica]
MLLFLFITGIVLIPQAFSLKCKECSVSGGTCDGSEIQCPAESTDCVVMKIFNYKGNTLESDSLIKACSKPDHCKEAAFNFGILRTFATSSCCRTDNCNTMQPPQADLKPNPNGKKCFRCDGKGDCTGTLNCDNQQTYCATGKIGDEIVKGCATKSLCVDPSPLLLSKIRPLDCCEGDFCNGSTSISTNLLLISTMVLSLLVWSN